MNYQNFQRNRNQGRPHRDELQDLKQALREIQCLADLSLKVTVRPNGYADKLAKFLKERGSRSLKATQLRKFFNAIKEATTKAKNGNLQKAREILWKTYPLVAYSRARGLIPEEFENIINTVIEKVESCSEEAKLRESFERLEDFMTALYAYFKKYEEKR